VGSPVLVPCLVTLRAEFDTVSPDRDKGADGWIGDSNHSSSSDHSPDEDSNVLQDHDADDKNEVHALDIDSSGPWPDSFKSMVMTVIEGEKRKWNDPDDKSRLNYVIYDRTIYDNDNDFEPANYSGSDPHTNHAHFSARYDTSCEADTRPWGLLEDDMSWDTEIELTDGCCDAFGKPHGTVMTASILLQTVGIHSARSADDADTAADYSQQADETLDQLVDAGVAVAQKTSLLRAILGAHAQQVGQLLAGSEPVSGSRTPRQRAQPVDDPAPQQPNDPWAQQQQGNAG
jgi:hypothetical protein